MVCRPGHENDPQEKIRHSCAHVMADAVQRLFPQAKVTIGPCIDNGFYYDFDYAQPFTPEDLEKIENEMQKVVGEKLEFKRIEVSKQEAIQLFQDKGENFKVEIIESLPADETITLYQHGDFLDLCKGPHVENTSQIKSFKLLSVAGSYWRGDEKRERLQRIYGTAFSDRKKLKKHLADLEEAKKRDHRKLGKDLDLFTFHAEAPASPFFLPKGALVYRLMADYLRKLYDRYGYQEVITPQILDTSLWEKSGHLDHFKDNMYFTDIEEREFAVKPMNCPGHCLIYKEKKYSYRDLPLRLADFGRLHRFERSGVTHGLTRVRTFCQDDAHIYCTRDQMFGEIQDFIKLVGEVYRVFGFEEILVALATKPESALGSQEIWDESESALKKALEEAGLEYTLNEGEGAFYGPKIEFQVKDALSRPWQLGTLQVDYSMPERFGLSYIDADGEAKQPIMLHRAILGSMERFFGILLEHCGGALPFWLAPVQLLLIPITENQLEYASQLQQRLIPLGYRVDIDGRNEKLGLKIRQAQLAKIPYMGVLGQKEVDSQNITLRHRAEGDKGSLTIDELLPLFEKERGALFEADLGDQ